MSSVKKIEQWIRRITKSQYSNRDFFSKYDVPFSLSQYYRYKQVMRSGKNISDGRKQGNHKKLSVQAEGFLLGLVESDPNFPLIEIQRLLNKRFNIVISESGVSKFLKRHGVIKKDVRQKNEQSVIRKFTPCCGLEIIVALAYHLGWLEFVSSTIKKRVWEIKRPGPLNMHT